VDWTRAARKEGKFFLCVIAALSLSLLWPGDSFWAGNEQAEILDLALQANSAHRLASYQRGGSTAAIPHPLTIWVYQFFLMATHDVISIIFVKQLIVLCTVLAGLYYLSRELNYNKYLILIYSSSFFHYALSRQIEDSSFLVLFSFLLYVLFAWFHRHKGYAPLICLAVCIIAVIHNSHRGLIAAVPFVVVFLVSEYTWLRKHWPGSMLVFVCAFFVCAPYLFKIMQNFYAREAYPLPEKDVSLSFLFTMVSGGLWYSYDFLQLIPDMYFRRFGIAPAVGRSVIGITMAGFLFLVLGMGLTVSRLVQRIRGRESFTLEDRFGVLALLTISFYMVLLFIFQLFNHYLYHSGLWFGSFYFIWRAVSAIQHKRLIKYIFPTYLAAMIALWAGCLITIHVNSDRIFTINKAIDIAGAIAVYSPDSDIVQLVSWADDGEKFADLIIANSGNAILGFYYREAGLSLKAACRAIQALNINLVYNALKPLVYIQRRGKSEFLPRRTLVIKNDNGPGKRGVMLVDDPRQVCIELDKL
jgi:hypothetical protein